ncbi:MAG: fimbrillin family protein, partial [Angelakisella sp.]
LDGAVVKLKSIVPTISFNLKTGIETNTATGTATNTATGTAADVTVMKAATASLKGSAIIIPQTIPTTQAFIEVTLKSGGILTHNLAMATAFASKSVYTYTITVKLTGLSVKSTITDWNPIGGTVTGDATM